jgi:hypothetical protein
MKQPQSSEVVPETQKLETKENIEKEAPKKTQYKPSVFTFLSQDTCVKLF